MSDDDTGPGGGEPRSRRDVLQGVAVTVLAGAAGYVAFAAYGPEPGNSVAYAPSAAGGGPEVLAALAEIPDGGGLVLRDPRLILTRRGDAVACFSAVCPHQGCLVSGVSDGVIACPCHGSTFDPETGAVVHGPAATALPAVPVTVTGDSVVRA